MPRCRLTSPSRAVSLPAPGAAGGRPDPGAVVVRSTGVNLVVGVSVVLCVASAELRSRAACAPTAVLPAAGPRDWVGVGAEELSLCAAMTCLLVTRAGSSGEGARSERRPTVGRAPWGRGPGDLRPVQRPDRLADRRFGHPGPARRRARLGRRGQRPLRRLGRPEQGLAEGPRRVGALRGTLPAGA